MKKYLVCFNGKYREMNSAEIVAEDKQPIGTQLYVFSDKTWHIMLPAGDMARWCPLEIGGVFHEYRAMALLLT